MSTPTPGVQLKRVRATQAAAALLGTRFPTWSRGFGDDEVEALKEAVAF